jgi:single-strand DNA-binding protein
MQSLNKFQGIGNIGKEPELRFLSSGTAVLNFSIAMTVKLKDANGETKELTKWLDATIFGKLAESMNTYLSTGKKVYIEGHLHTRQWEKDVDGTPVTMYRTGVIVQNIIMLSPKTVQPDTDDPIDTGDGEEVVADVEQAVEVVRQVKTAPKMTPAPKATVAPVKGKVAPVRK